MIRAVQAQTLRRNMTAGDIFAAIKVLAPLEAEKAKEHQGKAGESRTANESIAEQLGISPTMVARVKKILEHGAFVKGVADDRMSVRRAYEFILKNENAEAKKEERKLGIRRTPTRVAKNVTLPVEDMTTLLTIASAEHVPALEEIRGHCTGCMRAMLGNRIQALNGKGE